MLTYNRPQLIGRAIASACEQSFADWELIIVQDGSNPATAEIPIIALTAHALASDRDKSVEVGCADFDTKPVDLPRLLGKINACLGGAAGK